VICISIFVFFGCIIVFLIYNVRNFVEKQLFEILKSQYILKKKEKKYIVSKEDGKKNLSIKRAMMQGWQHGYMYKKIRQ